MINGHGMAHGGIVFTLADTAFACACNSYGPVTVAAGADIAFAAPVKEGDVLTASARERSRFGRSGIYDVTVLRVRPSSPSSAGAAASSKTAGNGDPKHRDRRRGARLDAIPRSSAVALRSLTWSNAG